MIYILHHLISAVFAIANSWPWLSKFLNRTLVNYLVGTARRRPHPLSTVHGYTSWRSLTDRKWSGRYLAPKTIENLPQAEEVAKLFSVGDEQQEYSEKSTLLFPFFAQYLTDGVIRTIMPNTSEGESDDLRKQNTSNHLLDLCSLYGRNRKQTHCLRLKSEKEGRRGRLKSQEKNGEEYAPFLYGHDGEVKEEFSDLDPVLGIDNFPGSKPTIFAFGGDRANVSPMISMINTLFLREHNRLAGELEFENKDWDDERVFEVTRNCIIAIYVKIVVEEYLNHISAINLRLIADPSIGWKAPWNKPNQITTEFSLFYRWHALVPNTIDWSGERVPVQKTFFNNQMLIDRGLSGTFEETSAQSATKLKMRNMSPALSVHEVKGINQGRLCELAPYVEYCDYFSVAPPESWEEFSNDPEVVRGLAELYERPQDVEFYVGTFAAEPTLNSPLSPFMLRLAAIDGFSQAYTNPIISENVWNEDTFTPIGWKTIQETSSMADLIARASTAAQSAFVGMTQPDWKPKAPDFVVSKALKETIALWNKPSGKQRVAGFAITTLAEALGLIFWLGLTLQGHHFLGILCLVAGEAVEWGALAYLIVKSPLSHPKRTGRVKWGLITSGLTSLSEAALWVIWFHLAQTQGILLATALLLIGMHAKHVTEMMIFTGKPWRRLAWSDRDMTASIIEVGGAAIWFMIAMSGHVALAGILLVVAIFLEHILQFKTAGLMQDRDKVLGRQGD